MTIGEKILELRKSKSYSQEEVAEKLGVTRQTISKWETDQSTPDFDKILPLCELYNISADHLLKDNLEEEDTDTKLEVKEDPKIRATTAKYLSISIFLYFVAIIWIIIGEELLAINEVIIVSVFLFICAIATVLLIYRFNSLPKQKIGIKTKVKEKSQKYKSAVEITSLIFILVYLCVSFTTMAWHITWLLWIVYAIAVEIIKLVFDSEGEKNGK